MITEKEEKKTKNSFDYRKTRLGGIICLNNLAYRLNSHE